MAEPELEPYRPVSLLAVAGFAVVSLWACFLVIGALVALISKTPWLLPYWTVLFPLAGIALSAVARFRIKQSEGTQTGTALTSWGVFLGVVPTLGYWAYYVALCVVVGPEAESITREWFNHLQSGNVDAAFCLTLQPVERPHKKPDGSIPHDDLEKMNYKVVETGLAPVGPYERFCHNRLVRIVQQGGTATQVQLIRASSPEYQGKEYVVRREYQISTPEGSWNVMVTVHTAENERSGRSAGRRWYVFMNETGITADLPLTPLGERMQILQSDSRNYLNAWMKPVMGPAHLVAQNGTAAALAPAGGPAASLLQVVVTARASESDVFRPRIAIDRHDPWAPEKLRSSSLLADVEAILQRPGGDLASVITLAEVRPARWRKEKGLLIIEHDFRLRLPPSPLPLSPAAGERGWGEGEQKQSPRSRVVEGVWMVETDSRAVDDRSSPRWRLGGIRLERAGEEVSRRLPQD